MQTASLGDPSQLQRINLITFFASHPSPFYAHSFTFYILDFPLLWIPLFPHVCCLLIPSLVRESVSALPHPLFGVSSSEILGNSGSCHSTGFSVHYPPRDCLSLFPDIIITQRFTQHMAVSATMKVPPASSGSDTSPCPLTSVGLGHDNDTGVLIRGTSLQFPSATGTVTDTHLTAQRVPCS